MRRWSRMARILMGIVVEDRKDTWGHLWNRGMGTGMWWISI